MLSHFLRVLALFTLFWLPALWAGDLDQDDVLRLRKEGAILPFDKVLAVASERYPNTQLLEVELERKRGVYLYEIELLTIAGTVRKLKIDAHDGHILKDKEDQACACSWWKTMYRWSMNYCQPSKRQVTRWIGEWTGAMPRHWQDLNLTT